jgi:hypothetical protein
MAAGLLLTASFSSWLVFVFPAWVLAFCVVLINRARKISRDLVISEPGELVQLQRAARS